MISLDGLAACRNPDCRALLPEGEGFYSKGRARGRDRLCKECRKARERERYASLDADSRQRRREQNRRAARRQRRRRGMRARHSWERTRVPIEPFREWLLRVLREEESVQALALRVGVDPERVRRLLGRSPERKNGRAYRCRRVELGTVERFVEAVGDGSRVEALYDLVEVERIRLGRGPIRARGKSEVARGRARARGRFAPEGSVATSRGD